MCGIIGYVGTGQVSRIIINGLKRMEYRGYDSAGIALLKNDLYLRKKKGKISELEGIVDHHSLSDYTIGIGHTRWATHGEPSDVNSHPHTDCTGNIVVVHNGIIENFEVLKKMLMDRGHVFRSQTDTEVLPHLIELFYEEKKNLLDAVMSALAIVEGTFGILVISAYDPNRIIAARKGSPLILGLGTGGMILASDASAIIEYTNRVIYFDDNEIVEVTANQYKTYTINRDSISKTIHSIDWDIESVEKQGYDHFMQKEIFEQAETIQNAFRGRIIPDSGEIRLNGLNMTDDELRSIERIVLIACGTSWHAGLIGEYLIEEFAGIPVDVEYASEFRYGTPLLKKNDLVIVISQSGETADTLAALKEAKSRGVRVLGITNVVGSTIARESDGGVYTHAGPEIGVASTKAFTSQITIIILLTILLGRRRNLSAENGRKYINALLDIPGHIRSILQNDGYIRSVAEIYKDSRNFLYLGRGVHFPVALEGALKLKEISYIHAEGYPAAEMKHGPIALIDENMPVVFLAPKDAIYKKVVSNMQEVRARKGRIIAIATEGDEEIESYADHVIYIPQSEKIVAPILTVVPLQLLAYHIAVFKNCDVDQPRNLAKSVTVE